MPKPDIRDDPTYKKILELLVMADERRLKIILAFIRSIT